MAFFPVLASSELDALRVLGIGLLGLLLLLALVPLFLWLVARLGGWHALALRFPAPATAPEPLGQRYHWRTLRLPPMAGYHRCLCVTLCPEGVHLRPELPWLLLGHRPLLFPWTVVGKLRSRPIPGREVHFAPIYAHERPLHLRLPAEARAEVDARAQAPDPVLEDPAPTGH